MKIIVTRCSACPFFVDSMSNIFGMLGKVLAPDVKSGSCCLDRDGFIALADLQIGLRPGSPERAEEEPRLRRSRERRAIKDASAVPDDCPLRQGDVTTTVSGGH